MIENSSQKDRNIIPRWRSPGATFAHGELEALPGAEPGALSLPVTNLARRRHEWERDPGIRTAADLLAVADASGELEEAVAAAEYLVQRRELLPRSLLRLVEQALQRGAMPLSEPGVLTRPRIVLEIAGLKQLVRINPGDAIAWSELARHLSMLGQSEPADRAMRCALARAPSNRYILRSAARMYLHQGRPDESHTLLIRHGDRNDPWILATECAVATTMGRSPHWFKPIKRIIAGRLPSAHLAELRTAVARLDADAGSQRMARKRVRSALEAPTENVIAQARWLQDNRDVDCGLDGDSLTRRSSEATARQLFTDGRFEESLPQIALWQGDQAFSGQPASLGSFIAACCLEDHERALEFLEPGLQASPRDPILLNNRAFSLARLGRLDEANEAIAALKVSLTTPRHRLMAAATAGLVLIRSGHVAEGTYLYRAAIDGFLRLEFPHAAGIAAFYLCDELRLAGRPEWRRVGAEVLEITKGVEAADWRVLRGKVEEALAAPTDEPDPAAATHNKPSQ